MTAEQAARRLALLGIVLQAMHVLFGITGIMGFAINAALIKRTQNTVYHSQIRWQLSTFWIIFFMYALALWNWQQNTQFWPVLMVLAFAMYRIGTSIWFWIYHQPINRLV